MKWKDHELQASSETLFEYGVFVPVALNDNDVAAMVTADLTTELNISLNIWWSLLLKQFIRNAAIYV